jgi:hypothetical protein
VKIKKPRREEKRRGKFTVAWMLRLPNDALEFSQWPRAFCGDVAPIQGRHHGISAQRTRRFAGSIQLPPSSDQAYPERRVTSRLTRRKWRVVFRLTAAATAPSHLGSRRGAPPSLKDSRPGGVTSWTPGGEQRSKSARKIKKGGRHWRPLGLGCLWSRATRV